MNVKKKNGDDVGRAGGGWESSDIYKFRHPPKTCFRADSESNRRVSRRYAGGRSEGCIRRLTASKEPLGHGWLDRPVLGACRSLIERLSRSPLGVGFCFSQL